MTGLKNRQEEGMESHSLIDAARNAGWNIDQGLAAQYAAQAGIDPDLAAAAGEKSWDVLRALRDALEHPNITQQFKLFRRAKERLEKADLSDHPELVAAIKNRLPTLKL